MKYLIVLPLILVLLSGCGSNDENGENNSVPQASRLHVSPSSRNDRQQREHELASYTTKILSQDPDRQKNIVLACGELNGKQVDANTVFSFTSTLGPATPEKGYEKATTFGGQGELIQDYGGGKCQLSSTLYNAVLQAHGLEVVERHEHSRDVDYVPEGRDAAVAYRWC
ncbi:MAG: VanW family protein [Oscillospiraceae bacterium]|nr:VanW family protein [Oscillospiraceae bacterium]